MFTKGLLGKSPFMSKLNIAMDVTNRLTGGSTNLPDDEQKKQSKPLGSVAITDFFFNNMKMIKSKLEKKKRE